MLERRQPARWSSSRLRSDSLRSPTASPGVVTVNQVFTVENQGFAAGSSLGVVVVDQNCLAASTGVSTVFLQNRRRQYFLQNQVFLTISSEQCLLNNIFSNSASQQFFWTVSSCRNDVFMSSSVERMSSSLFAARYLHFFRHPGTWLVQNVNQWGCPVYQCLRGVRPLALGSYA